MITETVRSLIFYLLYRKWSWGYNIKPSTDPAQADHNYTSISLFILWVIINPRFKEYMGIYWWKAPEHQFFNLGEALVLYLSSKIYTSFHR